MSDSHTQHQGVPKARRASHSHESGHHQGQGHAPSHPAPSHPVHTGTPPPSADDQFQIKDVYIQELHDAFVFYDKDGSGTISTTELGTIVRSLGQNPTEIELQNLINKADADCNGTIDFPEFVVLMTQKLNTCDAAETIAEAFRVFDKDGNGVIGLDELRHVMLNIGEEVTEEEVDEILKDADKSHDGLIEFDEFASMLSCSAAETPPSTMPKNNQHDTNTNKY